MVRFIEWVDLMDTYQLPRWSELPAIELYMDQVVEFVNECLAPLFPNNKKIITSTMINNYVKLKMIESPVKKRYARGHIASIIAITILKQIFPIIEITKGIAIHKKKYGSEKAFDLFCSEQEQAIKKICMQIKNEGNFNFHIDKQENMLLLELATIAFASKVFAVNMLEVHDKKKVKKKEN
jgi:Domain of unknown function (DUF1836).